MNYLRLTIALLLATCAQLAHADSLPTFYITQATMFLYPNQEDANVVFILTGPGVNITGFGSMACQEWCSGPVSSPGYFTSQIFVSGVSSAIFGGKSYDPMTLSFDSFFTANGGLNGRTTQTVGAGDTFIEFNLIAPTNGNWSANFAFFPAQGNTPAYYLFTNGQFDATAQTPEPGTLILMISGLVGVAGVAIRKSKFPL